MEKTLVVLLLLCALSLDHLGLSEEVSQPCQPCLSDIHAVLRDMSNKLGKYEVTIGQLQKDNQEQAEQLKVLLKDLAKQTSQVGTVTEQQQAQASESNSIKTEMVETLKRDKEVGRVAFSASLKSSEITLGPFSTHTPLVYSHVVTNIGNAYNPETGVFTAPVRGAYHFEFYIGAFGGSSQGTAVVLVRNEEHIFATWERQMNGFGTAANGATLLLEAGDVVFMRLWKQNVIFDNENRHSTFSGHLLFTM